MRILTVGIQEQQAPRYLFPLAWSLLIINAVFFYRLFRISAVSSVTRFEKMLIFAPALTVLVSQFAAVQFPESRATEMRIVFVFVIAAILVFVWLTRKNGKAAFLGSLVILLLFKLYTFQYHIVNWTATSTDSYYRALKDLHARLPPDCIIMGRMSGFVALEHPCRAYWPHTMRPDIQSPDFIIINGGREEIEGFASTNPFLAERLFSPDTTWMPQKYDIMNNYYSDRPTWVFRLRKPERAPPVIPSFWSVVYRRLTPGETCSPGTPAFSSAPPYGRRCSAAR